MKFPQSQQNTKSKQLKMQRDGIKGSMVLLLEDSQLDTSTLLEQKKVETSAQQFTVTFY